MKTTVKLSQSLRATVQPCRGTGGVLLEITHGLPFSSQSSETLHFTPDQAGVLIFGFEQALEVMAVREAAVTSAMRDAVKQAMKEGATS